MNLKALQKLSYGLYIVTSGKGNRLNGQVANTVFQITPEPPAIAVSIDIYCILNDHITNKLLSKL